MKKRAHDKKTATIYGHFVEAWHRSGARDFPEFSEVVERYLEPHRAYHSLEHVFECLRWFQMSRELAEHPPEVALALIYHDVVYDPRRVDNEERSAQMFRAHAHASGLPDSSIERVAALIEGTATHQARDADAALVNDIDLAVLGSSPRAFARYEERIRDEYAHVDELAFRAGREAVLRSFLESTSIYATPFFSKRLETQARRNLSRSLSALKSPPQPMSKRLIAYALLISIVVGLGWFLWVHPGKALLYGSLSLLSTFPTLFTLFPGIWTRGGEDLPDVATDLRRRRPVWDVLSELYLDTELDDDDYERIAVVLAESGYDTGQLEEILYRELHPVLIPNLLSVAGEWGGFDLDWLEMRIFSGPPKRSSVAIIFGKWMVRSDWSALKAKR